MKIKEIFETEDFYQGYTYSYPHKLAYRTVVEKSLSEIWSTQKQDSLFYYVHIPFCEMRCGFCNLFTVANPKEGVKLYLESIHKEMQTYRNEVPSLNFKNFAIGGGTPTFLNVEELNFLLDGMNKFGVNTSKYYGSIEASPKTLNQEKIELIESFGVARLSLGIQSWKEEEVKALGRPQNIIDTEKAVNLLAQSKIPEFNLDLIYGVKEQTVESFLYSVEKTISFAPTEIFLYPLYLRQLTGLGKKGVKDNTNRQQLYLAARDKLLSSGYEQTSMRCFRKTGTDYTKNNEGYNNILDGMIGIGAGARSYTSDFHYSTDYAVAKKEIKTIIDTYSQKESYEKIVHGINLDEDEQKRRFLIKSITDGGIFDVSIYEKTFKSNAFNEFEILNYLIENELMKEVKNNIFRLTLKGMCYEDVIGPALYSSKTINLINQYSWK
ncbi:coproporphyrinogen III oxidase [Tenacibaculum sp. Bg11-29]|uniref:STM4012 family radical SAM protein n=1 Tax=Tenacibaculum sp. Bg11-29 TaxID=2058306 RepID=UPI000C333C5D|nr:STM4012 family radical SAM protein [Tenacibaculum sp. Bg11-29]PKH51765.1 coproporphyrinogen III oxidase [Tenacibaculum sp. Bg11-29]